VKTKALSRNCPICNNDKGMVLVSQLFELWEGHPLRDNYDVTACTHCGFVFADTENTQDEYDRYYRELSKYEDTATSTGGGGNIYDSLRLSQTARDMALTITDRKDRILDLGCANGGLLRKLYGLGYENLVGIDPSPVCAGNTAGLLGIKTYAAGLFDIPPEAGAFDLIILSHVMEHILNLRGAISEVSYHLREQGLLYVEVPDAARYTDHINSPFQEFNMEHVNHFTLTDLDNLTGQSGFSKEKSGRKIIEIADGLLYPVIFGFYKKGGAVKPVERKHLEKNMISYVDSSAVLLERINEKILSIGARPVIVWGCGALTSKLLRCSSLKDKNILLLIDGNPILVGRKLAGKPICAPSALTLSRLAGDELIIIASTIQEDSITSDIRTKYHLSNPVMGFRDCLSRAKEVSLWD
jgi:SAM-dependent methyltransferase